MMMDELEQSFLNGGLAASWEAIFFGAVMTAFFFYSSIQQEKSAYLENIDQIRHESEKERDFFAVQNLLKTHRKRDVKKAIHKHLDFYYNHIRDCKGKPLPLDQSILLTNAFLSVDINNAASVAEVFRIARLVAPQKERAYFSLSGKTTDPIPEVVLGLLKKRINYLANQPQNEINSRESISEIVLLWQQFYDICTACECGAGVVKYIELSNTYVLSVLNRMLESWHQDDGDRVDEETDLRDLIRKDRALDVTANPPKGLGSGRIIGNLANIWHRLLLKA